MAIWGWGCARFAALIKAEVGLEAAAIDVGGWDTHFAQGSSEGQMAGLLEQLGLGLAAFHEDLADAMDGITLVVMTEFSRSVYENASLGTDHGHAGLMFVLGGLVEGGRVHAHWPGLEPEQLFGPGDLGRHDRLPRRPGGDLPQALEQHRPGSDLPELGPMSARSRPGPDRVRCGSRDEF